MNAGKEAVAAGEITDGPVFAAVIRPHRSLGASGFRTVMTLCCLAAIVASTPFVVLGFWPVAGFFRVSAGTSGVVLALSPDLQDEPQGGSGWRPLKPSTPFDRAAVTSRALVRHTSNIESKGFGFATTWWPRARVVIASEAAPRRERQCCGLKHTAAAEAMQEPLHLHSGPISVG